MLEVPIVAWIFIVSFCAVGIVQTFFTIVLAIANKVEGRRKKDDIISFIIKRLENVINDDIIKDSNTYLELNMKYAFQDIMQAIIKYLGKDGEEETDDKDRISNSSKTN